MSLQTIFETKIQEASSTQKEQLGMVREEDDREHFGQGVKTYRYVRYAGGTSGGNTSQGYLVYYLGSTPYLVTMDVSDTSNFLAAGVITTNVAINEYCWIQTGGFCGSLITDGNVDANGAILVAHATTDGATTSLTLTGELPIGVALAADSGTLLTASFLQLT